MLLSKLFNTQGNDSFEPTDYELTGWTPMFQYKTSLKGNMEFLQDNAGRSGNQKCQQEPLSSVQTIYFKNSSCLALPDLLCFTQKE